MSINRKYVQTGYSADGRRKTGKTKTIHAHNCRIADCCLRFKPDKGLLNENLCELAPANASYIRKVMWGSDCPHYERKNR